MFSFDVRFIKTVCDDTGHEHRACQAMFSVQAPSLTEAVRQAEASFCRQKRIHDWTMFADAVELKSPTAWKARDSARSQSRPANQVEITD